MVFSSGHQAIPVQSSCSPDTPQEVIYHGDPEDQANSSKLLTDKNVLIYIMIPV